MSKLYLWTRQQYTKMIENSILDEDEHVELIDGVVVTTPHISPLRATGILLVDDALGSVYGDNYLVDVQLPLALDPDSEPEPDVAVVPGIVKDYRDEHPKTAMLLVEVADATLAKDRMRKAALYARHGIPEYWIVNLPNDCLEVYRDPSGDTYETKTTLHRGDTVTPPRAEQAVAVANLLP